MKKIYLLMLMVLIAGTSIYATTPVSMKTESTRSNLQNEEWIFNGTLNVKSNTIGTLFNGPATITATPNGNEISLSISGITIIVPINLTINNLPYDGTKVPKGTTSTAMGFPVTFLQDFIINKSTCSGLKLRITGTDSGTITVTFN